MRIGGAAVSHALRRWLALARRASWSGAARRATLRGTLPLALGTAALVGMIVALSILGGAAGLWLLLFTPVFTSLVFPLAMAVAATERLPGLGRQAAIRAALMRRRCPACDYDLATPLAIATAGRAQASPAGTPTVICPECGAAWHARRIGDDAPEYQPRTVVIRG